MCNLFNINFHHKVITCLFVLNTQAVIIYTAHDIGMQPGEGGAECADEGHGVHPGTLEHVEHDQHFDMIRLEKIRNMMWPHQVKRTTLKFF